MLGREGLLAALAGDPLALYPALAALLLASVALASGLLRGDVLALARPVPVVWLLAGLAAASGLATAAGAAPVAWQTEALAGVARLPLYLLALAYGAVPALVAAALAGAYLPPIVLATAGPYHLGLELVVLGWLAVAPSPRRLALVAGLYALLAYALAAATLGVTTLALGGGHVSLDVLLGHAGLEPLGVLAMAAILALMPPRWFDALFPGSRIAPDDPARGPGADRALVPTARPADAAALPPPFERSPRVREGMEPIELRVGALGRGRRRTPDG